MFRLLFINHKLHYLKNNLYELYVMNSEFKFLKRKSLKFPIFRRLNVWEIVKIFGNSRFLGDRMF